MTKIILSNGTEYLPDFPVDDILKGMRNSEWIFVEDTGRDIVIRVSDIAALEKSTEDIIQPSERIKTRLEDLMEKYPNVNFWRDSDNKEYPMVSAYTLGYVSDQCAFHCDDEICCSGEQRKRCWNRLTSDKVWTCEPNEEDTDEKA